MKSAGSVETNLSMKSSEVSDFFCKSTAKKLEGQEAMAHKDVIFSVSSGLFHKTSKVAFLIFHNRF